MRYKIFLSPSAEHDIDLACTWYEDQQEGVADIFLSELAIFKEKVVQNPEIFGWANNTFRQARLGKFPYVVLYEVVRTEIHVYAVFHTSLDPRKKLKRFRDIK